MISKKMRNISMVCLSLVLALSLAFGLSSFSSIKKADAATTVTTGNLFEETAPNGVTFNIVGITMGTATGGNPSNSKNINFRVDSEYYSSFYITANVKAVSSSREIKIGTSAGNTGTRIGSSISNGSTATVTSGALSTDTLYYLNSSGSVVFNSVTLTLTPKETSGGSEGGSEGGNEGGDQGGSEGGSDETEGIETAETFNFVTGTYTVPSNNGSTAMIGTYKIYRSQSMSKESNNGLKSYKYSVGFYLKSAAYVTIDFANCTFIYNAINEAGYNNLGAADSSGTSVTSGKEILLSAGYYKLSETSSGSGSRYLKSINIEYVANAPEGYTSVGKIDGVQTFAKAEYLGASFKTTGASIRYGFILEVVNANGEALSDQVLETLKSKVTDGKFTFTTPGKANVIDVEKLGAGTVISNKVERSGIIANLVITNMSSANYSIATTTSISLTINGVEFTANSGAAASAQEKAQAAYNADLISDTVAGNFGITSKTNTDANE